MRINSLITTVLLLLLHLQLIGQWTIQHYDQYSRFNEVKFLSEAEGFLIGDHSMILKTTDGGASWNTISPGTDIFFQDFQLINESTVIGSGFHYEGTGDNMQSKVLKSVDYGNTWNIIGTFPGKQFYSQYFFDAETGLVSGYKGIWKTDDGGDSWDLLPDYSNATIQEIKCVNDTICYAIAGDELIRSVNQGTNWESIWDFETEIDNIYFFDDSLGFVGSYGKVFRTDDAGISWQEIEMVQNQTVLSMDFISEDVGFVLSSETCPCIPEQVNFYTSVSKTLDGGLTWESHTYPGTLYSIDFISEQLGYVSGANNLIMKYSGGDLSELPIEYPWRIVNSTEDFFAQKIYPNPVSDKLTIELSDYSRQPSIQLLSMEGKYIETGRRLLDSHIELELRQLPKGLYILKLSDSSRTQTLKIIKE